MAKRRHGERRWWEHTEVGLLLVHQEQGVLYANPAMRRYWGVELPEGADLPGLEQLPHWAQPSACCYQGELRLLVVSATGDAPGAVVLHVPGSPTGSSTAAVLYVPQQLAEPWRWLTRESDRLRCQLEERLRGGEVPLPAVALGPSAAAQRLRHQLQLAAASEAPVVVCGPAGSGRLELLRWIYSRWSQPANRSGQLLVLDGGLLSPELIQSSLSAFYQSLNTPGVPGTESRDTARAMILLHQLDRMSAATQQYLLQQFHAAGESIRWGATVTESTSREAPPRGSGELQERLSVLRVELPPLQCRREDMPEMALALLRELRPRQTLQGIEPEVLQLFADYDWPGQWDELRQVIRQGAEAAQGPALTRDDLPRYLRTWEQPLRQPERSINLEAVLQAVERRLIEETLTRCRGNKTQAARLLGLSRPRLYRRLKELGLDPED